ncbi:MAG: efflux RND transporter periplasmic adaptor subunit [Acidobacteriales bacterium]|nr:efflux RND transporter periplasmic adaptor subunit [Terriglobales bacterium]
MAKRLIIVLVAAALVVAVLGFVKFRQIQSAVQASAFQLPPEAVTSVVTHRENWPDALTAIGTTEAVHGVMVSADLPGTVAKINFDSGKPVHAGDILVELDTRQERAQLASLEAQSELAHINYGREQQLVKEGVISRMEFDQATSQQKATEANVAEIRATIARKTIRAPFSGILGIRKVNLGQYLPAGSPIVSNQTLNPIYVNVGIPQQSAASVRVGRKLTVTTENLAGKVFTGTVTAIDSEVDPSTRNIQIQATLPNPEGKLRPGMFVQVQVPVGGNQSVIALPATAINYAPYGDSVYVISDLKDPKGQTYRGVQQRFVKLGPSRGDQVAVISGLNPGEEVVSSGVFKLRNGAAVQVNNKVQPGNNPAPNPEES